MAGIFEWLDTLTTQVGTVAGKAVDVVGSVAAQRASATAAAVPDQSSASPAATLSGGLSFGGNGLLIAGVAAVVIVAAVIALRK